MKAKMKKIMDFLSISYPVMVSKRYEPDQGWILVITIKNPVFQLLRTLNEGYNNLMEDIRLKFIKENNLPICETCKGSKLVRNGAGLRCLDCGQDYEIWISVSNELEWPSFLVNNFLKHLLLLAKTKFETWKIAIDSKKFRLCKQHQSEESNS